MSKALFGHLATGIDPRLLDEVRLLRRQVGDLESELVALRSENDRLAASVRVDDEELVNLSDLEHASI